MTLQSKVTLGIHIGHDSACAIAIGGEVVAAIAQERVTRRKHDGQYRIDDRLPIREVAAAANVDLEGVDLVISSFQAACTGSLGFGDSLVSPSFSQFDVRGQRHFVISHHLAHAYCALGYAAAPETAVLICDLGGSSTIDGADFVLPFQQWEAALVTSSGAQALATECLSIYEFRNGQLVLRDREHVVPHSAPDSFVFSPASLYENVSQYVFEAENAYGQLMALAAYADADSTFLQVSDICTAQDGTVNWKNSWQHRVRDARISNFSAAAQLAAVTQAATEFSVLTYAERARRLTQCHTLAVAGGLFLNIKANSKLAVSRLFDSVAVPSSPADSGIAIGCALYGQQMLGERVVGSMVGSSDRLGRQYERSILEEALNSHRGMISVRNADPARVAQDLAKGAILARHAGRSEFGPRALGGRSLLASPLVPRSKEKLNLIKGRQPWRPVAPIVPSQQFGTFFEGPVSSHYMSYEHRVKAEHVQALAALAHPDQSTRAQTLNPACDHGLDELIMEFGRCTGYPIVVNTSLNGGSEPLLETPSDALRFFLCNSDVDLLLLDDLVVQRN